MAKIEALSPTTHRGLGINMQAHQAQFQGAVMLTPTEIIEAQREYPILFRKHPETGRLFPNALLGLTEHENLFIDENGHWQAHYIPLAVQKGPFLIGFKNEAGQPKAIISIDIENTCVDTNTNDYSVEENAIESLFEADNSASDYLNRVNDALLALHQGMQQLDAMIDAFMQAQLIEPITIDIELNNGETFVFAGAYSIAEEKLKALSAEQLLMLNQQGYLHLAYCISQSVANIGKLVNIKNQQK